MEFRELANGLNSPQNGRSGQRREATNLELIIVIIFFGGVFEYDPSSNALIHAWNSTEMLGLKCGAGQRIIEPIV